MNNILIGNNHNLKRMFVYDTFQNGVGFTNWPGRICMSDSSVRVVAVAMFDISDVP